jgi:arylsulfatase A-like enzyme
LQLDRDLARLLQALDQQVGAGNYLLFLTADHGAAHNWKFMNEHRLPGGPLYIDSLKNALNDYVKAKVGGTAPVIADIMDYRVFLDRKAVKEQGLELDKVKAALVECLLATPGVVTAVDYEKVRTSGIPQLLVERLLMGYHPRRSGDVVFIPEPQYYSWWNNLAPTHTTHGGWNPYDAHIPLLFFGWNVRHGATSREVHINDIAPTVCQMLHIQQPNACSGEAITEVIQP